MTTTAIHELVADQRRTMTEAARAAYRKALEERIDPAGTMAPADKAKAARLLRSEIMRDLGKKSGASRRASADQRARTKAEQALDELVDVIAAAVSERLSDAPKADS